MNLLVFIQLDFLVTALRITEQTTGNKIVFGKSNVFCRSVRFVRHVMAFYKKLRFGRAGLEPIAQFRIGFGRTVAMLRISTIKPFR